MSTSPVSTAMTVTVLPLLSLRQTASSMACSSHSLSLYLRSSRWRSVPSAWASSSSTKSGTSLMGTTMCTSVTSLPAVLAGHVDQLGDVEDAELAGVAGRLYSVLEA